MKESIEECSGLPRGVTVSDDGNFCAVVVNSYLEVYDVIKNKLVNRVEAITNLSATKALKFSPSKEAVAWLQTSPEDLCIVFTNKKNIFRISCHSDLPFCDILWSPDGKSLAAFSILSGFVDVYNVDLGEVTHIASISGAREDEFGSPLAQFSPDGEYFATCNISIQGYAITVYKSGDSSWDCIQRMVCRESYDVRGLLWCQDSASLLVWQSGPSLRLRLWAADGTVERSLTSDDAAVCCISLSDCGRVAAILTSDCKVRTLDILTWRLDMTEVLIHHPVIHSSSARLKLKEIEDSSKQVSNCEPIANTLFELFKDEPSPPKHRTLAQFCSDGDYLATYFASYPSTLWVWQLVDSRLDTVIVLREDTHITELLWHKDKAVLGANLSSGKVLVWTPRGAKIFKHTTNPWPLTAQEYFAYIEIPSDDELSIDFQ